MGFEVPVDVDYFEHPKTLALIGLIGPQADVFPLRLWRWCALYAKDGFVGGGRLQIETAVKWTGKKGDLHRALIKAGFLEKDGKTVHDFMKGIGRAMFLYEQKKLRQREKYARGILPEDFRQPSAYPGGDTLDERGDTTSPSENGKKTPKDAAEIARRMKEMGANRDGQ